MVQVEDLSLCSNSVGVTKGKVYIPENEGILMGEKYNLDQLSSFVTAIRDAGLGIQGIHPSYYLVSLNGGLPLFDVLNLVDRTVDSDKAIYFPGSSKINNSAEVLTRCFENFFLERKDQGLDRNPIASLDEVVSGRSVERLVNAYNAASRRIARSHLGGSQKQQEFVEKEARELREQFPLYVFGIREARPAGNKMDQKYLNRVKAGEVMEYPASKIITMDDHDFETIRFDHASSSGSVGHIYYPRVKEVVFTSQYRQFLDDVARFVGVDPETVNPARLRVSSDCEKYSKKPGNHIVG